MQWKRILRSEKLGVLFLGVLGCHNHIPQNLRIAKNQEMRRQLETAPLPASTGPAREFTHKREIGALIARVGFEGVYIIH